ncbi:MAG: fatty acid desaturase [Methylacidiphilales bacterium]|nr:fatty acid desaturase [Candidatus Methylacidiphilales bacterium]
MQETSPNPRPVAWYRTPLDKKDFKSLHEKSDFMGWLQTLGFLGLLLLTGGSALYAAGRWPIGVALILFFLYGTLCAFLINAVHELGHGTVFKTKALNAFFVRLFSFLGWINFEMFNTSHARHHRYTLHQPDDLEVVLPIKVILRHAFTYGIINPKALFWGVKESIRIARGKFKGEWELKLFPEGSPERKAAIVWARTMLVGHGLIIAFSAVFHLWLLPILTTFNGAYGGCLQFLCNNTQHIGLQDDVSDFRLCCRTFTINPFVQFIYWHMNFHIEHHMFAAVPCHKLGRLHRLIKHDLAPCPHGLVATWKEIAAIQKIQDADPDYQYVAPLPNAYRAESVPSVDDPAYSPSMP